MKRVLVTMLLVVGGAAVHSADVLAQGQGCATVGSPDAKTCVFPGGTFVIATAQTYWEMPYDSASTAVWVDGGTGEDSGVWTAKKRESFGICGEVTAYGNHWRIDGDDWDLVAEHLSASDVGFECD